MTRNIGEVLDSFEARVDTILRLTDDWRKYFEKSESEERRALGDLLNEFQTFTKTYFRYFTTEAGTGRLEYTLSKVLSRIQDEFANISLLCIQRKSEDFRSALSRADKRAGTYYERFGGFKPSATPLSYFGKYHEITRYPFTPYAIVSVPVEVYDQPGEWWALAHELGHHIYWNSADIDHYRGMHANLKNKVLQALVAFYYDITNPGNVADKTELGLPRQIMIEDLDSLLHIKETVALGERWMRWLEETFADICGTLIAGVGYVESAIARAKEAKLLKEDDLEHPIPCLRPFIAIEVLQWVCDHSKFKSHANIGALRELTAALRDDADSLFATANEIEAENEELDLEIIQKSIQAVVYAILECQAWALIDSVAQPAAVDAGVNAGDPYKERVGRLFEITPWLTMLPEIEFAAKERAEPRALARLAEEDNPAFEVLVDWMKKQIEEEEKLDGSALKNRLRERLLELDLGEPSGVGAYTSYTTAGGTTVKIYHSVPVRRWTWTWPWW